MKLKSSKIFWGSSPQTPLVASAFPYCRRLKAGRGLGMRLANIVCPYCALASAALCLRHWLFYTFNAQSACRILYCLCYFCSSGSSRICPCAIRSFYPIRCLREKKFRALPTCITSRLRSGVEEPGNEATVTL